MIPLHVPGSTSVQDLSQIGKVLVDEQAEVRLRGFPLIGSQKQVHSSLKQILRTSSQRFPARCRRPLCCSSP